MNYDFQKHYILLSFQRTMVDRDCAMRLNLREFAFQGLVTQVSNFFYLELIGFLGMHVKNRKVLCI